MEERSEAAKDLGEVIPENTADAVEPRSARQEGPCCGLGDL